MTLSIEKDIIMLPRHVIALTLVSLWCVCVDARTQGTFTYVVVCLVGLVGVLVIICDMFLVCAETKRFQRWFPDPY